MFCQLRRSDSYFICDLIENEAIFEGMEKGMEQGLRKGALQTSREAILEVFEERFDVVPKTISSAIHAIDNPSVLKFFLKKAATASSLHHLNP